jgi:tRNA (cytidine/uridine-2'-O-)-methyltransferase
MGAGARRASASDGAGNASIGGVAEGNSPEARLRANAPMRPFHVVLVEPEIPPNTGNVARLCAGTGSPLHLVGKLGFRIDEHAVRRAGLDYWHLVDVQTHPTLEDAEATIRAASATRRDDAIAIPLLGGVRSHNLANAVSIVLYEALRQTGQLNGARLAPP